MTRCPNTHRPIQWRGKRKYSLAGRTLQCVREVGHGGPCAWEPVYDAEWVRNTPQVPTAPAVVKVIDDVFVPQTPEQIAAGDARYREMLLRRRRG